MPMLLDAPTFTLNLTPESALSILQGEVARRGYRQWEVEEIRLVYVPYYIFSFDVSAEGSAQPSGKAALNAATGELDDFVPSILERPLTRTKTTDENGKPEVEPTNIARSDVERVAAVKVAAGVGLKKDNITVSAISKYYFPFYRIWANVGGEHGSSYTVNVDALMGAPLGLDAIAPRKKGIEDDTGAVFEKMKTPQGWISLIASIPSALTGGSGPVGEALSNKTTRWIILAAIVIILLLFITKGPSVSASCVPDPANVGPQPFLGIGLLGPSQVVATAGPNGLRTVQGTCTYVNNGNSQTTACTTVTLLINGNPSPILNQSCVLIQTPGTPYTARFILNWEYNQTPEFGNPKLSLSVQNNVLG